MNLDFSDVSVRVLAEMGVEILFHLTWQGLLVGVVVGAVNLSFVRRSANSRYALLTGAVLLLALLPILTGSIVFVRHANSPRAANIEGTSPASRPQLEATLEVRSDNRQALLQNEPSVRNANSPSPRQVTGMSRDVSAGNLQPVNESRDSARNHAGINWQVWLCCVYICVFSILAMNLVRAIFGGHRLCRRASDVGHPELQACLHRVATALNLKAPRLALSVDVAVPTVVGIWRATVLIPASYATSLTLSELESILLHELAHVRRYDFAVNVIQRIVEAMYFFHPVVWWLSYRLRIEREYCCDDLVIARGKGVDDYASALLRVADLARADRVKVRDCAGVHAAGSPSQLRKRVARLLGATAERHRFRASAAWPWAICISIAIVLGCAVAGSRTSAANSPLEQDEWGEPSGGLQMRVVAVAASVDEQLPELAEGHKESSFSSVEDVTMLVELKNVSNAAIELQGTRYGDTISKPWVNRSDSDRFAPSLFSYRIFDKAGDPVVVPRGIMESPTQMLSLTSGRAEKLNFGESVSMVLKPLGWDPSVASYLASGKYELEVAYHGTPKPVQESIAVHWPKRDLTDVWRGAVTGPRVQFAIQSGLETMHDLKWGEPIGGIRVAAEYRLADRSREKLDEYSRCVFPMNSRLAVTFHFQNVSDSAVEFKSDAWIQECSAFLVDQDGSEKRLSQALYTGLSQRKTWRLEPEQTVAIESIPIAFTNDRLTHEFAHPIGAVIEGEPGEYQIRHQIRDRSTGTTSLSIRARVAEDEPPLVETKLRFESSGDVQVEGGFVEVRRQGSGKVIYSGEIQSDELSLQTTRGPLVVYARIKGFEEETFHHVQPLPGGTNRFVLTRAKPIRFVVENVDGDPVSGARVYRFNRSTKRAGSDPLPNGSQDQPSLAESLADGSVLLDSVSEGEPADSRSGSNVYWFVIKHREFADRYVGPVMVGSDLGKIALAPSIEFSGTIIGTDEELENFRADFDQPVVMRPETDKHSWSYAVSERLEVKRVGKKLTFALSGLRPGKLRIIGNFTADSNNPRYVSGKREPNESDLVWEFDLTESRRDVILSRQESRND